MYTHGRPQGDVTELSVNEPTRGTKIGWSVLLCTEMVKHRTLELEYPGRELSSTTSGQCNSGSLVNLAASASSSTKWNNNDV